uniref:Dynactin subunit 6 n=1 Tax=Timema poppense TaxID=170557 RepID=A0A7R9CHS5_TIMPO|nr:unnamed protein product [Timema poppensis]
MPEKVGYVYLHLREEILRKPQYQTYGGGNASEMNFSAAPIHEPPPEQSYLDRLHYEGAEDRFRLGEGSIKILPGALVCKECDLQGEITIGSMTIVHPKVTIIAEAGPIIIGENNLIEEQTSIINRLPQGTTTPSATPVLIIGANNVFEVDSYSEAMKIGDSNVLESKAFIGRDVELTNGCIIGAGCRVVCPETVSENTIIYGDTRLRRKQADRPPVMSSQQS